MRVKDLENNISVEHVKTTIQIGGHGKTLTMPGSNHFGDKTTIIVHDHVNNKAYRFIDDRVHVAEVRYAKDENTYIYSMMPVNATWEDVISLSDDMSDAEYSFYTNHIFSFIKMNLFEIFAAKDRFFNAPRSTRSCRLTPVSTRWRNSILCRIVLEVLIFENVFDFLSVLRSLPLLSMLLAASCVLR